MIIVARPILRKVMTTGENESTPNLPAINAPAKKIVAMTIEI
jgi:hypothetical protein